MDLNVALPFTSSVLSFVFAVFLLDQWRERRRPYQLIWTIGMLWYGISAGTEFLGGALGWSEPLYRAWYLIGAIWVAGWLGLGTVFLLAKTRFGYAFAFSLGLAGLFTYLSYAKYRYPDSGAAPFIYAGIALALAVAIVVMTARRDDRWPLLAAGLVVAGSAVSAVMMATAPLAAGSYVDPATHIPTGQLLPGYLRLLTPFFNVTGAFALTFGALYSAYVFMPKRRVIRYERGRGVRAVARLPVAIAAIVVNFLASLPGALVSLVRGRLNSRVPATILIAIGGFIPAITSGANRFGSTSGFFVGELLGVVFLFLGFLVSVEVFREIRVPFTRIVLRSRHMEA
ncbi:MAG: hypothetical protein HYX57_02505 [Chloroflexi bacterium]|nr:hypothetical protein [Chloroflexota bacterium]